MRTGEPIRDFTEIYHESGVWTQTQWKGVQVCKYVSDLWTYQEILWETRPEVIIECGSGCGGSALFFADIMSGYTVPHVISIDKGVPVDDRSRNTQFRGGIRFICSDSVDPLTVAMVESIAGMSKAMVVLDSDHNAPHVLAEMEAYGPLVSPGCYMVVEDTIAALIMPQLGNDPSKAIAQYMEKHSRFEVDRSRERFLLTSNPGGYLKRIS